MDLDDLLSPTAFFIPLAVLAAMQPFEVWLALE